MRKFTNNEVICCGCKCDNLLYKIIKKNSFIVFSLIAASLQKSVQQKKADFFDVCTYGSE